MPPKEIKKGQKTPISEKSSIFGESEDGFVSPRSVSLALALEGNTFNSGNFIFLIIFNRQVLMETKWQNKMKLHVETLPLDLNEPLHQSLITDQPLVFLVRVIGGKGTKDPDPLLNMDNHAGATIDLLPLLLGEAKILVNVPLLNMSTGLNTDCSVDVIIKTRGDLNHTRVPLMVTMISAHCLPPSREGTVYLSAIGLNNIHDPISINFGMSLSNSKALKLVWASVSNGGFAANTAYNIPREDIFVPEKLERMDTTECNCVYWNAIKRVLIEPKKLRQRLKSEILVEIAGVPKFGKIDVRGRYMAFIDVGVLLEPGQFGITACAQLFHYNEADLPESVGGLLELPPTSAKISARETDIVLDEYGHAAYILLRFDLMDPLTAKSKIASLFEVIGFPPPQGSTVPVNDLRQDISSEEPILDVRRIRKESAALSVHKEINNLTCKGSLQINQNIKRTAANRLLLRVRSMLKQFPPGECSHMEWQDTVTAQHAASRRAVTASFAPQPTQPTPSSRVAVARSRLGENKRMADEHMNKNLTVSPCHPRYLLCKVLRCLEDDNYVEARNHLLKAISVQCRNRYLLWILGGIEFENSSSEISAAAFRIAVKCDPSDSTTGMIGWAALHALHHHNKNIYAAFVAARKMRKSSEIPQEWKKFLQRWIETSGEEEIYWIPNIIDSKNALLIASAFFLSLRCFNFSEKLLQCVEEGCATRGSRFSSKSEKTVDIFYLRAASLLVQRKLDIVFELIKNGIKEFGPSSMMSQMRAICLTCIRGWDGECENALLEADRSGAEPCAWLLLQAALGGLKNDTSTALQRAARAHKIAPSAYSALVIGRAYAKIEEEVIAERWAAVAVNIEPLFADGWAFLGVLALYDRNIDKARTMLRTAKQAGPISPDIQEELRKTMKIVRIDTLPDLLVKDLCLCEYY